MYLANQKARLSPGESDFFHRLLMVGIAGSESKGKRNNRTRQKTSNLGKNVKMWEIPWHFSVFLLTWSFAEAPYLNKLHLIDSNLY